MKVKSQRDLRIEIINVIYAAELLNEQINLSDLFNADNDLSNKQFKILENIKSNYDFYKKIIESFLKETWQWNRISPLHRAIMLNATNEFMSQIPPRIVINEAIEITKIYFDDHTYKMINAILESIYKYLINIEVLSRKF
ncbi:Transcription termination protein NusB [Mycoplasmopsis meleagridis]|uniref:Transcription termination protein NusB n=1 Tax=Mycoplasmopsis meleagridis ATCC 25294 TaxID=1264554 RepID=A0A0F5H178_9BACT|nr:transcription antitermination protein NusB [Mycoplasmopsis meleagridis]KKB26968.1 Transcription termination protein NusB [Mycoplasmopsis meleagridis ATCC 25294]KUH47222.1 antitermination protein NusB [Mycoplasmopsis meleagridis]OAD18557.1 Transcription termination protein NusB [Mycoplasmopsis meleagridis]